MTNGLSKFRSLDYEAKFGITKSQYTNIHIWLQTHFGKANKCEATTCLGKCKYFDWSLKEGHAYTKNRDSFINLCRSCHIKQGLTEEVLKDIAAKKRGIPIPQTQKAIIVTNLATGEEHRFNSISGATNALGLYRGALSPVLHGHRKSSCGFSARFAKPPSPPLKAKE